jgi:hypothetical protein
MPLVSVDAMRQAYFRDAGAKYNDILYLSKPSDWKFQFTTPNASTHYVYFNFNLKATDLDIQLVLENANISAPRNTSRNGTPRMLRRIQFT